MTYFNKKEEVLDIELTQYGKHLLSIGKLNPTYYRFFDDDVLYDGAYAGIEEIQNDISPRIVDNTPHRKTQHNHVGIETQLKTNYNEKQKPYTVAEYKKVKMPPTVEKQYVLNNDLGFSSMGEKMAPSFNLGLLNGKIENFSQTLTSSYQDLPIPQIEVDLAYKLQVRDLKTGGVGATDTELASPLFDDDTFFGVYPDHILGFFIENNVPFEKENFNIEVYELIDVSGSQGTKLEQELKQLSFATIPNPAIVNDILLDMKEIKKPIFNLTSDHVEYFFDILTDGEISESILCEHASKMKSLNISVDLGVDCPDLPFTNVIVDPYFSAIDSQKVIVCDDDGETN